jgi:hypothetical protein
MAVTFMAGEQGQWMAPSHLPNRRSNPGPYAGCGVTSDKKLLEVRVALLLALMKALAKGKRRR